MTRRPIRSCAPGFFYADDTHMHVFFAPGGNSELNTMDRLCSCLLEIGEWSRTNLLKLNDHKADVIVFGTKQQLPTLKDFRITVRDTTRIPSTSVRCIRFLPRYD